MGSYHLGISIVPEVVGVVRGELVGEICGIGGVIVEN